MVEFVNVAALTDLFAYYYLCVFICFVCIILRIINS